MGLIQNEYSSNLKKQSFFLGRAVARAPISGFFVRLSVRLSVTVSLLSKRPSLFCLIHFRGSFGAAQRQLVGNSGAEVDFRWKMTLDGRRPSMEDNLWWKPTFNGRRPLMEDDLWRRLFIKQLTNCRSPHSTGHILLCGTFSICHFKNWKILKMANFK